MIERVILGGCIVFLLALGVRWVIAGRPRPLSVVLRLVAVCVLAAAASFGVALAQWSKDWRVCDAHWGGTSTASVDCMEARKDSRWGPFDAFGPTANITNVDDD